MMNVPSGPIRSAPTTPTSSGEPPRPAGEILIMRLYSSPRGPFNSSLASGVKNFARADRVDPCAALVPPHCLGHYAQRMSALGDLLCVEGIGHLIRLEHQDRKQLIGWHSCKGKVLLSGQCRQAMPGLRRDDDASAPIAIIGNGKKADRVLQNASSSRPNPVEQVALQP